MICRWIADARFISVIFNQYRCAMRPCNLFLRVGVGVGVGGYVIYWEVGKVYKLVSVIHLWG